MSMDVLIDEFEPLLAKDLFDGRLEEFGIKEDRKNSANYLATEKSFRYLSDGQGLLAVEVNKDGYIRFDNYVPMDPEPLLGALNEAFGIQFWMPEHYEEKLYFYLWDEGHDEKIDDRLYQNITRKSGGHVDEKELERVKAGIKTILLNLNPELIDDEGEEALARRVDACTAFFLSWYTKTFTLNVYVKEAKDGRDTAEEKTRRQTEQISDADEESSDADEWLTMSEVFELTLAAATTGELPEDDGSLERAMLHFMRKNGVESVESVIRRKLTEEEYDCVFTFTKPPAD